jgi:hypothetical protein
MTSYQSQSSKAEAKREHEVEAEREATEKAAAKSKAAKPVAKTRTVPTMPAGGTIIVAKDGYSVLTATKAADGILRFPPPLVVIAWSIGADGAAFPVTEVPVSADAIDVGTVHTNGAVTDAEGKVHAGPNEWQAAVRASEAETSGPPVNVDRPYVGQSTDTLSCTMGNWAGVPDTYAYQWKRDGADVAGEVSATYAVQPSDVGSTMACVVTATNLSGSATAASNDVVVT